MKRNSGTQKYESIQSNNNQSNNTIDYSLYLVTDSENISKSKYSTIDSIVKEAINGGVSLVQLREKTASTKEFYKIAKSLQSICKNESNENNESSSSGKNIPLIINDRIDILLAINGDGLHIGQDDMPVKVARDLIGNDKILGVSASTIEEAKSAEKDGADYLGVGAVFHTNTKDDASLVTLEELKKIVNSVSIPVVAIGGINESNIEKLNDTGIKGVSIVSAIMNNPDPKEATTELLKKVEKIL
ncbi:MAG: thiamine phosphate synthase [Methanobacteriaceae archaeon]